MKLKYKPIRKEVRNSIIEFVYDSISQSTKITVNHSLHISVMYPVKNYVRTSILFPIANAVDQTLKGHNEIKL